MVLPLFTLIKIFSSIKSLEDHLDFDTIKALGPNVTYFVPLGNKSWFESLKFPNVFECDWWDAHVFKDLEIVCTPCQVHIQYFTSSADIARFTQSFLALYR